MRQCPVCAKTFEDRTGVCPDDGSRLRASDPLLGAVLDQKYRVDAFVGAGGMGTVYRATQLALARDVAVKIIRESVAKDSHAVERFQREALLLARLSHPSIVGIFDFGYVAGVGAYIVMELLRGRSLHVEILRRGRIPAAEAAAIMSQVCRAVHAAHTAGIVHRDLKPDNVFVEQDADGWSVKILDFGVAKLAGNPDALPSVTGAGAALGTPLYMSPEQCLDGIADERSDVYGLGCVLYELLTGRPPFVGGSVASLMLRHASETPRPPGVAPAIDDVALRALAKDPAERFATADEMARALATADVTAEFGAPSLAGRRAAGAGVGRYTLAAVPVARDREVADLRDRLVRAGAGEGQLALVSGEAGVGKTRLLEELERVARARGFGVLHGRFSGDDRVFPFNGFCDAIEEYFRVERGPGLSDLVPALATLFPTLGDARPAARQQAADRTFEDQREVFDLLARTFQRIAADRPHVLLFEELHAAAISIEALDYVVARLRSSRILVVGTFRASEMERGHPLSRLVNSMRGGDRFLHVALGPLASDAHRVLLASLLGNEQIDETAAAMLYAATGGNPFFTKELLRSLVESHALADDGRGVWSLDPGSALGPEALPATIQEAVEARLARLPERDLDLLVAASVLGRTFRLRDLEPLAGGGPDVEAALDALVEGRFLDEDRTVGPDGFAFTSGMLRDALYRKLPRRRRRALHRAHAEQIERRWVGREDRVRPQLVHHWAHADLPEKVVEHALRLAESALATFSPGDAAAAATLALEHGGRVEEPDPVVEAAARVALAAARRLGGEPRVALAEVDAAIAALAASARGAPTPATVSQRAAALALAAEIAWEVRDVDRARVYVERGLAASREAGLDRELARVLSIGARLANLAGEHERAAGMLAEAERLAPAKAEPEELNAAAASGVLRIAVGEVMRSNDPAREYAWTHSEIMMTIYDTLTRTGDEAQVLPWLCERYEAAPGGRRFTFWLRDGVRFCDGRPLTARDVAWSFERVLQDEKAPGRFLLAGIRGAEAVRAREAASLEGITIASDLELTVELDTPLGFFPAVLTAPTAAIVPEGTTHFGSSWRDGAVGTGPFRVVSSEPGVSIDLEANPYYWRTGLPRCRALSFQFKVDNAARVAGLRDGSFAVVKGILGEAGAPLRRDPAFVAGWRRTPALGIVHTVPNIHRGPLADLETRRRFVAAVDPERFLADYPVDLGVPALGLIPPGLLGYDPTMRRPAPVPAPAGDPVALTCATPTAYAPIAEAMVPAWRTAGFEVRIVPDASGSFNRARVAGDADVICYGWDADYPDADTFVYALMHSGEGYVKAYTGTPELDALAERARVETDPRTRHALYREAEELIAREALTAVLYYRHEEWFARPEVAGVTSHFFFPSLLFETLRWRDA